jgi:hypothetical protein
VGDVMINGEKLLPRFRGEDDPMRFQQALVARLCSAASALRKS